MLDGDDDCPRAPSVAKTANPIRILILNALRKKQNMVFMLLIEYLWRNEANKITQRFKSLKP